MSNARRKRILQFIDAMLYWPDWADERERDELVKTGFIYDDEGSMVLSSLGELEVGYPNTTE